MDLQLTCNGLATDSFLLQNMAAKLGAIIGDDIAMDLAVASLQLNDFVANLQRVDNKITVYNLTMCKEVI